MFQLPLIERNVFIAAAALFFAASILALLQFFRTSEKYRVMIIPLVALGVSLESIILVFRAVDIKSIPLTSLFDSMIVLSIAFGLTFLFLSVTIRHVWFTAVMVWLIILLMILSGLVASPASNVDVVAQTPWVIWHGLSMILSGAAILFSGSMAALYLLAHRNLKLKRINRVIGKIPNIEKLEFLNVIGIKSAFAFLSFGVISGIGFAVVKSAEISVSFSSWVTDSKIVLVLISWVLLAVLIVLRHFLLRARGVAVITLISSFLIIFSMIGSSIFCESEHDFSQRPPASVVTEGQG